MIPLDQITQAMGWEWLLAGLLGLGFVVGVLTGLFGVGGGFMITPLLNVLFGIPYDLAVGSSVSFTIGTGASGAALHARSRNFEPRSTVILALTSMVAAWLGAGLGLWFKDHYGVHTYTLAMHGLFIVVLLLTAGMIAQTPKEGHASRSPLQRMPIGPFIDLPAADLPHVSITGMALVGMLIGLMKGVMGIGGGVLFMPLLVVVVGLLPHKAVGTSLGVVVFSSIAGTIKFAREGKVSLWVVMTLLVGSVLGVQLGGLLCERLNGRKLRRYFALLVLVIVALTAYEMLHEFRRGGQ